MPTSTTDRCAWCRGPLPAGARRDSITCSKRCRQARHRFTRGVGVAAGPSSTAGPLRLAYADPPYPGMAGYYEGHRDYAGEVDHADLIRRLVANYDGWALSTSASTLRHVLALVPDDVTVRIASWHRGPRRIRAAGPVNAWEPVIYAGGRLGMDVEPVDARHLTDDQDVAPTRLPRRIDTLDYAARARLTDPNRVIGAKPARFARWVFDLLGAQPGDTLDDLYPGSGGISRAWATYTSAALAAATPTE